MKWSFIVYNDSFFFFFQLILSFLAKKNLFLKLTINGEVGQMRKYAVIMVFIVPSLTGMTKSPPKWRFLPKKKVAYIVLKKIKLVVLVT